MGVQKAIIPGLLFGIFMLIGFANLMMSSPGSGRHNQQSSYAVQNVGPAPAVQRDRVERSAANLGDCSISDAYPQSIQQWCVYIDQYAKQYGLDPNLISAVMLQESSGRQDAYSKSGAVGLMQVMPRDGKAAAFMCPKGPCFADRPSAEDLFDPEYNVSYAAWMLADLLQRHGDLREALRAYGPMDVGYYYADLVIGIMNSHQ